MITTGRLLEGDDGMAGRKRRGWNKYIADYDKLRMFLRYISYGCYHKQYLARQLGQSARSYEDNWARVRSFLPEDRLQAVRRATARFTASRVIRITARSTTSRIRMPSNR